MIRLSKIIGFLFGGVFAVLLSGALFLLATWDGVSLRTELSHDMRERCERQIAMERTPQLAFRPGPTLVIDGLAVGERNAPGIAVKVGRVEAGLAIWPLIAGKRVLTRLTFREADVHLVRNAAGRYSLADLEQCVTDNPAWADRLKFESIDVVQGRFDYRDAQHGDPIRLERISVSTGALVSGARGRLRGEASLTQAPGTASGGLTLDLAYHLEPKGFDVESARFAFRGSAWGVTALDAELSARSGHGEIGHALALEGIVLHADGRLNTATLTAKARADAFQGRDLSWALRALKAQVRVTDARTRTEATLEAAAIAPRDPGQPGEPVQAEFKTENDSRATEGTLAGRIAFRQASNLLELDSLLARWTSTASAPHSTSWHGQIGGRLAVSLLGTRGEGALQAQLDAARMRLAGDFDLTRPAPWRVDIDADRIEPERLATALNLPSGRSLLARLAAFKSTGTLRTGPLTLAGLRGSHLEATYATEDGHLHLQPMLAQLYGGTLSGALSFDPDSGRFALQHQLAGIELGALLQDLHRNAPLRGKLSGNWNLEGVSGQWDKAIRLVTGNAQWQLQDAEWLGADLPDLLRAVRPALKTHEVRERGPQSHEKTAFAELALGCQLSDGRAQCDTFSAHNGWARLGGQGSVQLPGGTLDWSTRVAVQSRGPLPRDLYGLRRVVIPFRLTGPVTRPNYKLDWRPSAPPVKAAVPVRARPAPKPRVPDAPPLEPAPAADAAG